MGFFRDILRKSQGLPTDSEISQGVSALRIQIAKLMLCADGLDAVNNYSSDINLGFALRVDLLSFSLHIAASDGVLEESEVAAINCFLGINMPYDECKRAIEGLGIDTLTHRIPLSFQMLTEEARSVDLNPRKYADMMIATFQALGQIIAMVDGEIAESERQDLNHYINKLKEFANTL